MNPLLMRPTDAADAEPGGAGGAVGASAVGALGGGVAGPVAPVPGRAGGVGEAGEAQQDQTEGNFLSDTYVTTWKRLTAQKSLLGKIFLQQICQLTQPPISGRVRATSCVCASPRQAEQQKHPTAPHLHAPDESVLTIFDGKVPYELRAGRYPNKGGCRK